MFWIGMNNQVFTICFTYLLCIYNNILLINIADLFKVPIECFKTIYENKWQLVLYSSRLCIFCIYLIYLKINIDLFHRTWSTYRSFYIFYSKRQKRKKKKEHIYDKM